ncbi:MAG: hypothetical protein COA82_01885 [Alkaliphilus sp.]|nr:DUF2508 family protein [Alkaliphilus transvaalensis]PHS36052.1 MAG: hypothetical protein COA82_01885 [Alkaliphilus sp.]
MRSEENSRGNFFSSISSSVEFLYNRVFDERSENTDQSDTYADLVHKAHEEWKHAENLFHNISDPDLIDYAVYNLDAAKSRYIYLLKKVREERE